MADAERSRRPDNSLRIALHRLSGITLCGLGLFFLGQIVGPMIWLDWLLFGVVGGMLLIAAIFFWAATKATALR